MELDNGDLFVITRGFLLNTSQGGFAAFLTGVQPPPPDENAPKHYDRSWHGIVFKALAVVDQSVAAEVVANTKSYDVESQAVGTKHSVDLSEIEVMTVPTEYLEALQPKEQALNLHIPDGDATGDSHTRNKMTRIPIFV
jgi:hypothetical protein